MRIYKIEPNTEAEFVTIESGLDAMQAVVGGNIEVLGLPNGCDVWINEEGKLNGLQLNKVATAFCQFNTGIALTDVIVGTMFVTGPPDSNGECTDCPDVIATMVADANL